MMAEEEDPDQLFERYKHNGTQAQKEALAENYLDLFHELCYDYACGKLLPDGVQLLPEIVEKIEVLKDLTDWSLRAQAFEILMEDAEEREETEAVIKNGHLAIEASRRYVAEQGEYKQIYLNKISFCYYTLISYEPQAIDEYWMRSLEYSKNSICEDPEKANWIQYFHLLYSFLKNPTPRTVYEQAKERSFMREWSLSLGNNGSLYFVIASSFIRYKEIQTYQEQFIFPEQEYLYWLEASLHEEKPQSSERRLSEAGHFYRKEGVRLKRIDLLEKALSLFQKMFYEEGELFALYYATDALEQLAILHNARGNGVYADVAIQQALDWNEEHRELIGQNFSVLLHYAEFLERCYHYQGSIFKPSLSLIEEIAVQAEAKGEGYYSGPYLILARVAMESKQERKAVRELSKMLLLHELCVNEGILEFYKTLDRTAFPYVEKFLKSTMMFMSEVKEGYVFDPQIKISELEEMSEEQIIDAWILRKAEIRKHVRKNN